MISTDTAPAKAVLPHRPRLLVVGCGAIGGIIGAHLFEQGHDVTALTTNSLIADAINVHGFRLRGDQSPGTVRGRAIRALQSSVAPFDYILLATQPPQVEAAAQSVVHSLTPDGKMVCLQNGLCEDRVAKIAGSERTLGAIVAWGASMLEPGVYDRTSSGGFVLGRLDGASDERLDQLAHILEAVGPTTITSNLVGARWSKLALNCVTSSLGAIGGDRLGALVRHRFVRRLGLEIMTEVVQVARSADVRLEKVAGTLDLNWIALTEAERHVVGSASLVAKHALLLAVGARYRRLRSSMLAAIERGRVPAIEFLNGEVIARGAGFGIPTAINEAIRDEVLAIAARRKNPSIEVLRDLFQRTRVLVAISSSPISAVSGSANETTEGANETTEGLVAPSEPEQEIRPQPPTYPHPPDNG